MANWIEKGNQTKYHTSTEDLSSLAVQLLSQKAFSLLSSLAQKSWKSFKRRFWKFSSPVAGLEAVFQRRPIIWFQDHRKPICKLTPITEMFTHWREYIVPSSQVRNRLCCFCRSRVGWCTPRVGSTTACLLRWCSGWCCSAWSSGYSESWSGHFFGGTKSQKMSN